MENKKWVEFIRLLSKNIIYSEAINKMNLLRHYSISLFSKPILLPRPVHPS
jgi:hypothetical protein